MQTCFKTTTIQKSLEVLLKDAYEDFSKLKNKLDKGTEINSNLSNLQI